MASPSNPERAALRHRVILSLAVAGALAVAGCGAASASPAASVQASGAPAAASPAVTAAAASSAASADAGSNACGGDAAATIKDHIASASVVEVTIIGGCHMAAIATSLAATDVAGALAVCDKAAEVAYTGGVSSISVVASTARELAVGLKGAACIGEP